jgi:hypothetical protein
MGQTLEYGEYKNLIDLLEQSNHERTYEEVMNKEEKVLDTMNNVIKFYNDDAVSQKQIINQPILFVVKRFFSVWTDIINDLTKITSFQSFLDVFIKDGRLVYIGAMFVILSIILYYIELTENSGENVAAAAAQPVHYVHVPQQPLNVVHKL